MSNLDLSTVDEKSLEDITIKDALSLWKKMNKPAKSFSQNEIKVNNVMANSDGSLNANYGKLEARKWNAETKEVEIEVLGDDAEFLQLASMFRAISMDWDGTKPKYSTKEYFQGEDIEVLDVSGNVVFTGQYKVAKEKFNLKYIHNVYVHYNGDVYLWAMKGATLAPWFDFQSELNTDEPTTFKVKEINLESNKAIKYWVPVFKVGKKFDPRIAVNLQFELQKLLADRRNAASANGEEGRAKDETDVDLVYSHGNSSDNGELDFLK